VLNPNPNRHSTASGISGIGSALSSSNSSIMGDPDQPPDTGEEWGPQHPCYPHLNPHVPLDSPEYAHTRIIRVRRDWLLEGDLAPTFSNLYPDILDPAGVSEQEFRRVIDKLNRELVPIFSPYAWRNILDNVLGLATGWLWDDLGFTAAKTRLRSLERWIEQWNAEMEKAAGAEEGVIPPKIVPLRRTGYMTVCVASELEMWVGTDACSLIYKYPTPSWRLLRQRRPLLRGMGPSRCRLSRLLRLRRRTWRDAFFSSLFCSLIPLD
jgi:hypothetical protein